MAGKGQGSGPARPVQAHILIIEGRYYAEVADELAAGALAVLDANGSTHERIVVPGALEIPQALVAALDTGAEFDGVVALGCVIRGETSHYDIVVTNTNHWLMDTAHREAIPLGNAVLTVDRMDQALARAKGGAEGKGGDAARACLRLIEIRRAFESRAA